MFKDSEKFESNTQEIPEDEEYRLAPNDEITMKIVPDGGFPLINGLSGGNQQQNSLLSNRRGGIPFDININGDARLPLLGYVKVAGLTTRQVELMLQERYSKYYNDPYILVDVTTQRVFVSTGQGSSTRVVQLSNNNITLFEALALAGGISANGNAKKIKLIRNKDNDEGREIFRIDLSTVDGLAQADMAVQSGDIIYVQPVRNYAREIVANVTPYLSLISTALLIISLNNQIRN